MDRETREFLEQKFGAIDDRFTRVDQQFEETKRYFGVVAEGLRSDIRLVAEGHDVLLQEARDFREEIRSEFKEVRSLIKFSYAELDQRITTVERELVSLQTRLERLEARQT